MTVRRYWRIAAWGLAAASVGAPLLASAGYRQTNVQGEVTITTYADGGGTAYGALGHAHNAADNSQYIGCGRTYKVGEGGYGICVARDASGKTLACTTSHLGFVMAYLRHDSAVRFTVNSAGECVLVSPRGYSKFAPPQP